MKIKVAAIQMSTDIGMHAQNVARAKQLVREAAKQGAKICVLPELGLDEFFGQWKDPKYFSYAEPVDGEDVKAFQQLAKETGMYIALPIFERCVTGNCYNSVVLISDEGETVGVYHKNHIPYSLTYEKYYFTPGEGFPVFDTKYGKVGILICYDRRYPESCRELIKKGAEIILIPIASWRTKNSSQSELPFWESELRTRAVENQAYIIAANKSGEEADLVFIGHSMIVAPGGDVLAKTDDSENTIVIAELDTDLVPTIRNTRSLFRDRRPDLYN